MRRDALTGLPNRRAFEEELEHEVRRAVRGHGGVAVILLDLNGFKAVNDRFGHLEGDRSLMCVARAIREALRDRDLACRWAGDEFAVLLRDVSREQALEAARRIDARVRLTCATPSGEPLSVKWGVAFEHGACADDVMRSADAALVDATRFRRDVPERRER